MEVNELMIGDWVYNTHNQKYEQVQEIRSGHVMLDYNDLYDYDEIEPILLTPEILEKNGWVKAKCAYGRHCMEIDGVNEFPEGSDNVAENTLSFARWSIDKDYRYHFLDLYMWRGGVKQYDVHYVHQLQHAFRIFGVEKEIKL